MYIILNPAEITSVKRGKMRSREEVYHSISRNEHKRSSAGRREERFAGRNDWKLFEFGDQSTGWFRHWCRGFPWVSSFQLPFAPNTVRIRSIGPLHPCETFGRARYWIIKFMEIFKREIFEQLGNLFDCLFRRSADIAYVFRRTADSVLKRLAYGDAASGWRQSFRGVVHFKGLIISALRNERVQAEDAYRRFERFYLQRYERKNEIAFQRVRQKSEIRI